VGAGLGLGEQGFYQDCLEQHIESIAYPGDPVYDRLWGLPTA